ncbi:MAG TPA: ABC transporter ATP-binding protein [Thermodesulfobacteriota bacterium]|nr:ABC transporter ATP-binding protein [Thermodesulfobacteriota bacterium]
MRKGPFFRNLLEDLGIEFGGGECVDLAKRFGGLEAVSRVTLKVAAGERRAVIGPNGAGKTTLFRLISGEFPPTSGTLRLFGRDITRLPCHRRAALGLGGTFQVTNLFPTMTVADNLVTAALALRGTKFSMARPLSTYRDIYAAADETLKRVGMIEKRAWPVRVLSHGEQRQIEIAMALVSNPQVLLLGEPTAGLPPAESGLMTATLEKLDPKITILIIEHDMDVAFRLAGRITVLHHGRVFFEGTPGEVRGHVGEREIYFGAEVKSC